jgi:hypothetical protein
MDGRPVTVDQDGHITRSSVARRDRRYLLSLFDRQQLRVTEEENLLVVGRRSVIGQQLHFTLDNSRVICDPDSFRPRPSFLYPSGCTPEILSRLAHKRQTVPRLQRD